ncbi:MAG: DUF4040 domain-containing protein [Alphaproteobacteria bacterium]|nr:DUF4040 domain-containing protein [Alphaproteobacteria bacterium]MBE8220035.1 DUF4040 domain-containing protein [Alphaproteobacteria bacterium]
MIGDLLINVGAVSLLAIFAFWILRTRYLVGVVVVSGAFSLTAAALFVVLDAVDVAFTEAAVGAGIATVLGLATLTFVPHFEKPHRFKGAALGISWFPALLAVATGLLLTLAVSDLPRFGSADAPIHNHVAPHYINESPNEIGIPNIVTAILASYRGYDTLGEVIVIFTAALAVLVLLVGRTRSRRDKQRKGRRQ